MRKPKEPEDYFSSARPFVVHCLSNLPYDVYIGRPSVWGNPFTSKSTPGGKARAIELYTQWLHLERPELIEKAKRELRGKILGCWCKEGSPCHGLVLAKIANE